MKVIGQAAEVVIDYLKSHSKEGGYKADCKSGKALEACFNNETFLTWVNAYAEFKPGFGEKLKNILMDLSSPRKDSFESIWQNGLLSATSPEKLQVLESRLRDALALPYQRSVDFARMYLPRRTRIHVDVYVTVDPFNTGMMRPGRVFRSILLAEPSAELAGGLAHEFHHAGAYYWLDKNPQLRTLRNSHAHASMLAEVVTYLVAEGLANWYASSAIHIVEGEEEQNRIIRKLEKRMPQLRRDLEHLLLLICEQHKPFQEVKEDFQTLSIDMSGQGIPAGHFLSGQMVGAMEKSKNIPRGKIIGLVKHPFEFFEFYNRAVAEKDRLSASLLKLITSKVSGWTGRLNDQRQNNESFRVS